MRVQKSLLNYKEVPKISMMYTLNQLRKTFITKLLENGIPLHTIRALEEHSSIQPTINYYVAVNVNKIGDELNRKGIFRDNFRYNIRVKKI